MMHRADAASGRNPTLTTSQVAARKALRKPTLRSIEPEVGALERAILNSLEEAKAEDIITLSLLGKTSLADAMFVATGRSSVHVRAIADRVVKACRAAGFPSPRIEGLPTCDWVLLDARDAIVHIFRPDVRQFYNLEKMWGDDRPAEMRSIRSA